MVIFFLSLGLALPAWNFRNAKIDQSFSNLWLFVRNQGRYRPLEEWRREEALLVNYAIEFTYLKILNFNLYTVPIRLCAEKVLFTYYVMDSRLSIKQIVMQFL